MGTPVIPSEVMLFTSVLFHDTKAAGKAIESLKERYGRTSYESEAMAFDYTSYYEAEMGFPISRILVAFEELVPRDCLPEVKLRTNGLEEELSAEGKRSVNLDPGILSMENVCLATTKPYSHRIYLARGIWGEVTLMYQKDSYQALPWTYPDYASPDMMRVFNSLRALYREKSRCQGA